MRALRTCRAPASGTHLPHRFMRMPYRADKRAIGSIPRCFVAGRRSRIVHPSPRRRHAIAHGQNKRLPKEPLACMSAPFSASAPNGARRTTDSAGPSGTSPHPPPREPDRNRPAPARSTQAAGAAARSRPAEAAGNTPEPARHTQEPAQSARQTRCRRSRAPTPLRARPALRVRPHLQSTAHCVESFPSPAAGAPGKSRSRRGIRYLYCIQGPAHR